MFALSRFAEGDLWGTFGSGENTVMEMRTLGKTGLEVSTLGFGGSEIRDADLHTVERLLNAALDAGLNTIDTAECYGDSEEKIGQAIAHRRNDFHLFTKCGHASGLPGEDWNPAMLAQTIDRSLSRLRADHVDLVQLHSCGEDLLRQGDVIAVLQDARAQGKTRFIGYSGDRENARYAIDCGAFDTLQTSMNIADQEPLTLTLPAAQKADMGIIIKRPLANAFWTHGSTAPPKDAYEYAYWERGQKLGYDFLTTGRAAEVALRFVLSQPGVTTAIAGTKNPGRWAQNAALLAPGPLPPAELDAIRARWHEVAAPGWIGQT